MKTIDLYQELKDCSGTHVDGSKPFVIITRYKKSGKLYDTEVRTLTREEIATIEGGYWKAEELFEDDMTSKEMIYTIIGVGLEAFCHFLIPAKL